MYFQVGTYKSEITSEPYIGTKLENDLWFFKLYSIFTIEIGKDKVHVVDYTIRFTTAELVLSKVQQTALPFLILQGRYCNISLHKIFQLKEVIRYLFFKMGEKIDTNFARFVVQND